MRIKERTSRFTAVEEIRKINLYQYFRQIDTDIDSEILMNGHRILMFGSGDYLGLANHPEIKAAAFGAISRFGVSGTGSRFFNGTQALHNDFEAELAAFLGKEDAILFPSRYLANLGVIASLATRDNALIISHASHPSLYEGSQLAPGRTIKFDHQNTEELESHLRQLRHSALIAIEGIYADNCDMVPLPDIVRLARQFDCDILMDDTHGIGILGERGQGTASHFGMAEFIDIFTGSFGASLASTGGFVAGDKTVIDYLRHHAKPLIFSTALSPASVAAAKTALRISIREPERLKNLWANVERFLAGLRDRGIRSTTTKIPIISIAIGSEMTVFKISQSLFESGIFVNPITSPIVAPGESSIKFSVSASHTFEQIDRVLDTTHQVLKKNGIL